MISREKIKQREINDVLDKLKVSLIKKLEKKGYEKLVSSHECLGIITEEYHELVEAVTLNNDKNIRLELTDVAIAALFSLISFTDI